MLLRLSIDKATSVFDKTQTVVDEKEFYQFIKHLNDEYNSPNGIIVNWNLPDVEDGKIDVSITIYDGYMEWLSGRFRN